MVQWYNGSMVQWFNGSMVQWFNGIMVQWYNFLIKTGHVKFVVFLVKIKSI